MPIPAGLAEFAASQTVGILRDEIDLRTQGEPSYLKDGQPESITGKLGLHAGRLTCRQWARQRDTVPPARSAALDTACRPYLESIGEYPGSDTVKPPFNGGQCNGVTYLVTLSGRNLCSAQQTTSAFADGPIQGTRIVDVPGVDCQGNPGKGIEVIGKDGRTYSTTLTIIRADDVNTFSITSIQRVDDQPDNCGNPPSDYTPGPVFVGPPINPRFNPGPEIDVDITVDIGPDGGIEINFDPNGGGPSVPIDPYGGGDGGGGAPPGDRGIAGEPEDSGDGPIQGCVEPGNRLTGLLVELIAAASFVNKTGGDGFMVYRGVCYVLMGGEPGLDLQPEGSTVIFPQFFEAPENSTCYAVFVNPGYRIRVTPFFRPDEEEAA